MKSTGIVRKVDKLGRVVIPKELRGTMDIPEGTPLEVYVDGETIILKKFERGCIFCRQVNQNNQNLIRYQCKDICQDCLDEIKRR